MQLNDASVTVSNDPETGIWTAKHDDTLQEFEGNNVFSVLGQLDDYLAGITE